MTETACARRKTTRVCGADFPAEVVKSQLLKLDAEHIRFVLKCLHENTSKVKNIKQYLLATLYNAPLTINSYYSALVSHDLAEPGWQRNRERGGAYACPLMCPKVLSHVHLALVGAASICTIIAFVLCWVLI